MVEEKPKEDGQEERKLGIDEERTELAISTAEGVSRSDSALEDVAVAHIICVIFLGAVLQTVGLALSYNLPIGLKVPAAQYGFEAMIGFGCGLTLTTLVLITLSVVGKRDLAVAMGALTQCRVLGGAIGIAMATNLVNNRVKSTLSFTLSEAQLNSLFIEPTEAIRMLQPALQDQARMAFATGYNLQTRALLGFSAAEFLALALMWERRPRMTASS